METNKIEEVYTLKKTLIELDVILENWKEISSFSGYTSYGALDFNISNNNNLRHNIEDKLKELKTEIETQLENL